jgi:DNA-directed RNA polymerase specialized sigma subunit
VSERTYRVRATRWAGGWELHIEDVGVTQVRTLALAESQVRDYLDSLLGVDSADGEVVIVPELENEAREVRADLDAAAAAQLRAAERSRRLVRSLRDNGLSVTDTAAVLGVTRSRVSQLLRSTPASRAVKASVRSSPSDSKRRN